MAAPIIRQFREYAIRPTLLDLGMYSAAAEELLVATAAHESGGLRYLAQWPAGPARGVYQMEPATAVDVVRRYLGRRLDIKGVFDKTVLLLAYSGIQWNDIEPDVIGLKLATDLRFATAIARVRYWMVPKPLPSPADVRGMAEYWKAHWNTLEGAGRIQDFIDNYERHVR